MKGPRVVAVSQKKPDAVMMKKRKSENRTAKVKVGKKKDSNVPKRPKSVYLFFMDDYRTSFKENYPDNKSISAVGKAGGEKWRLMSAADKAPYIRKTEYERALEAYKKKLDDNGVGLPEAEDSSNSISEVRSGKSTSEIHDEAGQEVSSEIN